MPRPSTYFMRIGYSVLGGHTHFSIWTGKTGYTLGKAGDGCMTNEEFEAWRTNTIGTVFIGKENKEKERP